MQSKLERAINQRQAMLEKSLAERWVVVAVNDFEQVWCLNMDRRQDRWDRFQANISSFAWPFRKPERFAAIDGWRLPVPDKYGYGMSGAYGCMQGHRRILEAAILAGVADRGGAILVMEDDATFRPTFPEEYETFRNHLPEDWEFLFIGGQSGGNLKPVNEHVAAVHWANRWHCYAVRGQMIRDLYKFLCSTEGHCDLVTWPFLRERKTYAPRPRWLCCQDGNLWSDIASRMETIPRCWNETPPNAWTVYLRAPREVAEELYRMQLLHPGFNRDPETGVDCWLQEQIRTHGRTGTSAATVIRGFLNGLQGEAIGIGAGVVACLWEPNLPPETARQAIGQHILEVEADTVTEAIEKLLGGNSEQKPIDSSSR